MRDEWGKPLAEQSCIRMVEGVPGIEIQDGILCISILHSVPGIEIIRFIKHHVKADIQNEKNTCRPIKTTGGKRYLAAS